VHTVAPPTRQRARVESDDFIAFTEERASTLVGVHEQTLRRWAAQQLVKPSVTKKLSTRNIVRLYDFRDLMALLVVQALQETISHQYLRRVIDRLRKEYEQPLTELVFAVSGKEVFFQHPDGSWEGGRVPNQTVAKVVIPLAEIRTTIRDAAKNPRANEVVGRVERRRKVLGSKEVFAGTRVPVDAVRAFLEEGATESEILEAFPRLTGDDIEVVRKQSAV
jgi:uncharacterized protein (DUF433 family)